MKEKIKPILEVKHKKGNSYQVTVINPTRIRKGKLLNTTIKAKNFPEALKIGEDLFKEFKDEQYEIEVA